jgi:hypothetical protein
MLKVMLSPALAFASGTMPVKPTAAAIPTASKVLFTYFSLSFFLESVVKVLFTTYGVRRSEKLGDAMGCHLIVKS